MATRVTQFNTMLPSVCNEEVQCADLLLKRAESLVEVTFVDNI